MGNMNTPSSLQTAPSIHPRIEKSPPRKNPSGSDYRSAPNFQASPPSHDSMYSRIKAIIAMNLQKQIQDSPKSSH